MYDFHNNCPWLVSENRHNSWKPTVLDQHCLPLSHHIIIIISRFLIVKYMYVNLYQQSGSSKLEVSVASYLFSMTRVETLRKHNIVVICICKYG